MIRPSVLQWPKISIVTPSFNQGKFLEKTIQSVLVQEYPNLEYLIIDGGSTDNSLELIRQYAPHLFHWESTPDNGQYDAVQKGFQRSSGEVMAYLNSDDLYFPWTLRVVGEIFSTFPNVEWLTTSRPCTTPPDGRVPLLHERFNRSRRWFLSIRGERFNSAHFIQQEATFWRRSLWEKTGSNLRIDLHYAADFELWSRFYEKANLVTVDVPLAMFRFHREQKTAQMGGYIEEAEQVISRYDRPVPLPAKMIRALNLIFQWSNRKANWFGARCDNIAYDLQQDRWVYHKALEWGD
jgi:glycosyltransferase involved in cell wall biosynthesis